MPSIQGRAIQGIAIAMAIAVVSLTAVWVVVRKPAGDATAALVEAASTLSHRPTAGRLTGGFAYRSYPNRITRSSVVSVDLSQSRLLKAAETVESRAIKEPTPEHRHALAVAHLLTGNLDAAIALLERILGDPPTDAALVEAIRRSNDARLLADLAAAYYERGMLEADPAEITLSLEAAERSWRIAATPEAAWNRALAMDALHLRRLAQEAWRVYLQVDSKSAYRGEARTRLTALGQPSDEEVWARSSAVIDTAVMRGDQAEVERLVRRFPQKSRVYGEQRIDDWSRHWLDGRLVEAKRNVDIARAIGAALTAHSGERFLLDTVHCIDDTRASELRRLATAHSMYATGYAAYRNGELSSAATTMASVETMFARRRSPYAVQAAIVRASCAFLANDLGTCTDTVQQVRRLGLRDSGWKTAAALADWVYSLPALAAGDIGSAVDVRLAARETFARTGELEHLAAIDSLLAEVYEFAGDRRRAWVHRTEAMKTAARDGSPQRIYLTFDEAAEAALQQKRIAAALLFQQVMAEDARRRGDPAELADSQRWRAGAFLIAEEYPEARREIAEGRRVAASIEDGAIRKRITADLDLYDAQALLDSDSSSAAEVAARALGFFTSMGKSARVAEATLIRARSFIRLGDVDRAMSLLQETLPEIEAQRSTIEDLRLRLTYLGLRSAAYSELAALLIDRGAHTDALAVAERGTARAVLDGAELGARPGGAARQFDIAALRRSLAPNVSVVTYARMPNYVGAWVIRKDTVHFKRLTAPKIPVRRRRGRAYPPMTAEARRVLERELIHPLWPWLDGSAAAIFTAAPPLDALPFASLRAEDGRRIIEHFPVATAPSVTVWSVLSQRRCPPAPASRVLVISQGSSANRPLRAAAEEARFVASFARDAVTLAGDQVTAGRVAREVPLADLIHLIAHGAPSDQPFEAGVQAFPDGKLWTAHDVIDLALKPCTAVVLSGCATAAGAAVGEESATSLANSFLASGARSVIATLWDVDDAAAAEFMHVFHAQLARGRAVGEAFRNAQLTRAGAHGDSWAAFQLIGAL